MMFDYESTYTHCGKEDLTTSSDVAIQVILNAVDAIRCHNMAGLSAHRFLLLSRGVNITDQISSLYSWMAEPMFPIPMT